MPAQKRISVDAVLEAYRVTGLKPGRKDPAFCAWGALAKSTGLIYAGDYARSFGASYEWGFCAAFDGHKHGKFAEQPPSLDQARYDEGFSDGAAVAAAVLTPAEEQSNG